MASATVPAFLRICKMRNLLGLVAYVLLAAASLAAARPDTLLIEAIKVGNLPVVHAMIATADVNSADADGATALHWAAHRDDEETVVMLLRRQANVNVRTRLGVSPLTLACTNGNAAIVRRLLDAGAD